ncbi:MAG: hypothetical protein LBQ91_06005 [Oscillospiraceae bacterium]|jgi:hypothetical protein|nr:hypothetical protein [Oscillospiraceae bacterium]
MKSSTLPITRDYIAVVWPTGYDYRAEIYAQYAAHSETSGLSEIVTKTFGSPADFMSFIYDVYKNDDLSREILAHKTKIMVRLPQLRCAVFSFSCSSSVSENLVDPAVLAVKTSTRELVAAKMDDYYYDILFHATDTKAELDSLSAVLARHGITL